MAIKIECTQCGFRNDLGRMFCTRCGVKLDLKRTSPAELEDQRGFEFGRIIGRILGWLIVVLVIGGVGLAFWPVRRPAPRIDSGGDQQVVMKTRAVKKAISSGKAATVDFSAPELNGFLATRARSRQFKSLVIELRPGEFSLYGEAGWKPALATNVGWMARSQFAVPISFEITGRFADGRLVMQGARMGHLPLVGPACSVATEFFKGAFVDIIAERQVTDALGAVTLEQDKATLKFGR